MEYRIAKKLPDIQENIILQVVSASMKISGCVSFAMGSPAVESIPVDILKECAQEAFNENPMAVLQYGPMAGDAALAEWIKSRVVHAKGATAEDNKVIILTGSGKALGLVPRTLCDEGDEVYMDEFTFPNAYISVRNVGGVAVGIPMDEDGMLPQELEKAAQSGKGKYIYLIPNFQNPTGRTMSLERRKAIYAIAQKYKLVIYEDDPYGDVRFKGEAVPTFKSFDMDNRVLYVGAFSKTLSAGLRVGYIYGPSVLIDKLAAVRSGDGQDPLFNQLIIRKCLEKLSFEEHLANVQRIYGRKAALITEILQRECSAKCRVEAPDGGMFVWVTMPEEIDVDAFCQRALESGVAVVKSAAFAVDAAKPGHGIRLNFSAPTDENIIKGSKLFAKLTREFCD